MSVMTSLNCLFKQCFPRTRPGKLSGPAALLTFTNLQTGCCLHSPPRFSLSFCPQIHYRRLTIAFCTKDLSALLAQRPDRHLYLFIHESHIGHSMAAIIFMRVWTTWPYHTNSFKSCVFILNYFCAPNT